MGGRTEKVLLKSAILIHEGQNPSHLPASRLCDDYLVPVKKTVIMIMGLGTDIVEIASIQKAMEQSNRFAKRVFTTNEITYCESKPLMYQHYAARFAAKEAMMKALKTGWDKGVQWKQVEVINQPCGTPMIVLGGRAKELLDKMGATNIEVSLSHSEQYAVAVVCVQ